MAGRQSEDHITQKPLRDHAANLNWRGLCAQDAPGRWQRIIGATKAAPEQQAIRGKPGPKDNDLEISNWRLRTERERRESAVGGGGEGERCPAEYAGGFGCEIPCDCPAWKGCEWAAWNG